MINRAAIGFNGNTIFPMVKLQNRPRGEAFVHVRRTSTNAYRPFGVPRSGGKGKIQARWPPEGGIPG
jgi:hypothetical protein